MSQEEKCKCEDKERCCCLHFREAWTPGSIYRPGDAVPNSGSSYVAIHWNQNDPPPSANWATIASKGGPGPAGPAGPQGIAGPPGPAGANGVVNAFALHRSFDDAIASGTNLGSGGSEIGSLSVPAGNYFVMGSAWLFNNDSDWQAWVLEMYQAGTLFAKMSGTIPGTGANAFVGQDPVPGGGSVMGVCTMSASGLLTLRGYGYSVYTQEIDFVAIPVGTIFHS